MERPTKTSEDEPVAHAHLERFMTTQSIPITPELFEKLYLSPHNIVKGDLRKKFANPTPVALGGFLLSLTPISCILLGWQGAGGLGASDVGAYIYFGGLLMLLGAVGEFLLGNSFPTVVFSTFGAFWFTFGATLTPSYGAYAAYATDPQDPLSGLTSPQFQASFAFFLMWMGVLCTVFLIASIRTNIVFFVIFLIVIPAFECLAAAFWHNSKGNLELGLKLQHAGAGILLVASLLGWYIFLALVLAGVDFPYELPLGDLSTRIPGASDRAVRARHVESPI
ncbi:GPR1/FUN34/yaaH family-domain-containing protein [Dactylonectria estremocensis]|uniref:GPR1/FUN34/yaaH family-domain-containing protein n=1 Tax=Dactylonectria estremocensis TaxID=1079267 RepID=A0A9P9E4D7_9HYPO|nr:GPR1/FUN34/yaaH family-domain-containing protein [Dactylonectria estremocensis]